MPKFVIEREIPGAGKLSAEQLKAISQTSCGVLSKMGTQIQWIHSYVTDNKIYCIYSAPNEEMVREHAIPFILSTMRLPIRFKIVHFRDPPRVQPMLFCFSTPGSLRVMMAIQYSIATLLA